MAAFPKRVLNFKFVATILLCVVALAINTSAQDTGSADLQSFLQGRLLSRVCPVAENAVARRVFAEYGAMFAASDLVIFPSKCIFENGEEVQRFHERLKIKTAIFRGVSISLQAAAMNALLAADAEATVLNLKITPLDGSIAGGRNYSDTVRLWSSRFHPALDHWTSSGRISTDDANAVRGLPVLLQVEKVMQWEAQGMFFSTGFSKSIFSSVAPPGTSQHLSLLAFDVVETGDKAIREILNRHGWYQTIVNDRPHFTFLGVAESELPRRGLKAVQINGHTFWVPNLEPKQPTIAGATF